MRRKATRGAVSASIGPCLRLCLRPYTRRAAPNCRGGAERGSESAGRLRVPRRRPRPCTTPSLPGAYPVPPRQRFVRRTQRRHTAGSVGRQRTFTYHASVSNTVQVGQATAQRPGSASTLRLQSLLARHGERLAEQLRDVPAGPERGAPAEHRPPEGGGAERLAADGPQQ